MIRTRLAVLALTAGFGLVCCGCLNLSGRSSCNGNGCGNGGGFFSFLHRNNHDTVTECCPAPECPTCAMDSGFDGPILEQAPASVVPMMPSAPLPMTAPPTRLVPTPATSNQMPWSP